MAPRPRRPAGAVGASHARGRRREPEQPDGRVPEAETSARRSRSFCADRGIALVSDEVFADFAFRDGPATGQERRARRAGPRLRPRRSLEELRAPAAQARPGARCRGPEPLRREALGAARGRGRHLPLRLDPGAGGRPATPRPAARSCRRRFARAIAREPRRLCARERPGSPADAARARRRLVAPSCACRPRESEEERVTRLLEDHDVLVHPGYFFDFPREAYLVLSLLPEPAVFAEGVGRIARRPSCYKRKRLRRRLHR